MTSHPTPRRPLLGAQPTTWALHAVVAMFLVIGLLAVAISVAAQVRDDPRIWAPGPFASSPAPAFPVRDELR
ncbi:MAG: hypothetical protein WBL35_03445 [Ornithinibacter sp.]